MDDREKRRERLAAISIAAGERMRALGFACGHVLPGEGPIDARIVLVGTVPGEEEERAGHLWAGRAGVILDTLLESAGLVRRELYATNLLKCPLPLFRRPKMTEIEAGREFLEEEIRIVDPKVVAPLGYYPTKALLAWSGFGSPRRDEYRRLYGIARKTNGRMILPLPNPAALIPAPEIADWAREVYSHLRRVVDSE